MRSASEVVRFNGVVFRRYPDAREWAERMYFVPHIEARRRGVGRLHEEIWKAANGPIPDGSHIHHRDGNPLNNNVSNLVCLSEAEHANWHHEHPTPSSPRRVAHLEAIREKAAAWHGSDAGREWHRAHGRETLLQREAQSVACEQCGATYVTAAIGAHRFCSNRCRSAARRAAAVDDEQRLCANCGAAFRVNRYRPTRCCSRKCAQQLRRTEHPT